MNKYLLSLLFCLPLIGGGVLVTVDASHAGPDDRRERKQEVRSDRRDHKQDVHSDRREYKQDVYDDRREVRQDVRDEHHEHYERHETASNVARTAVAVGATAAIVNAVSDD